MALGTVRKYDVERGFGFIAPDMGGADLFVHIRSCAEGLDELRAGDRVRYDERPSAKYPSKLEAFAVALID